MTVKFKDIEDAFDFLNFSQMSNSEAYLEKETGKIYLYSDLMDDELEELPEDVYDEDKYIALPDKNELDLGKKLVFDFASKFLPDDFEQVDFIFSRKGAYSNFKQLLAEKGLLDKWYKYEEEAEEKALREWCEWNDIKLQD
jgi:hypothetical protein